MPNPSSAISCSYYNTIVVWLRRLLVVVGAAAALAVVPTATTGADSAAQVDLSDVTGGVHKPAIDALNAQGVFAGTGCAEGFCPDDPLDRATMAVWTVRILDNEDPQPVASTRFADVDATHPHADFIERFAELGVTHGCGDGIRYCPNRSVPRAEMAAFLSRAFDLPDAPAADFEDVSPDAWYAPEVAKLTASAITAGCGDGTRFCPNQATTRAEMATFLHRAIGFTEATTPTPTTTYKAVTASEHHTCAIASNDTIECWGNNRFGQADAPAGTYKTITAGTHHTCAVTTNDTIKCWGANWYRQADAPLGAYKAVTAGRWHACAIATNDTIKCWGYNDYGQADAPAGTYKAVTATWDHTCAIASDGAIKCWGANRFGQADAPEGTYKTITAGTYHTCAIASDDTIKCWGIHSFGQADGPPGTYKAVSAG
ncbi:MAG: S-layer homology domain-containing protein, partial [Gemmatimonadota bacterium]|nr:S-layer homology domain-containing protein [Gemmatimonadota bacterium]